MDKSFSGVLGNGPVREIETMGELVNFVTLGPIHSELSCKEDRQGIKVVFVNLEAKKMKGVTDDLEITRQKALKFVQQVVEHRGLQGAESFLRQKEKVVFADGTMLSTQNLRLIRKEG